MPFFIGDKLQSLIVIFSPLTASIQSSTPPSIVQLLTVTLLQFENFNISEYSSAIAFSGITLFDIHVPSL